MKKLILIFTLLTTTLFGFEHLNSSNMDKKVQKGDYIVDFYASWCPPCKVISKNLKSYDKNKSDEVTIYKVDIDQQRALANQYNIKSLPSLVYIRNGEVQALEVGLRSVEELKLDIKKHFN